MGMIPETMKAVRQHETGGRLFTETIPVPEPGPGEVLVKIAASPINYSDLAVIKEGYRGLSYPAIPGLEGSGTVVRAGKGIIPSLRMGKRVACSPIEGGGGTWAEYMKTSAMHTIPLPAATDLMQGSMMLVNPVTALALIHMAVKEGHAAMVNNAAASALGKMLIRLARKQNIPLINIVRKEEQVPILHEEGATHVLNSNDPTFEKELHKLAAELGATLILDAVTGEESHRLLRAAPDGSTLVAYARLSGNPIQADPADLIKYGKTITGFQLGLWLRSTPALSKLRFIRQVRKQLSGPLASHIRATYPLNEVESAISIYRENMSAGKVLLSEQ